MVLSGSLVERSARSDCGLCAPWLAAIARAVAEDGDVREGSQRYRQNLFSVSRAPVRSCGFLLALLVSYVTLAHICATGAIIWRGTLVAAPLGSSRVASMLQLAAVSN